MVLIAPGSGYLSIVIKIESLGRQDNEGLKEYEHPC